MLPCRLWFMMLWLDRRLPLGSLVSENFKVKANRPRFSLHSRQTLQRARKPMKTKQIRRFAETQRKMEKSISWKFNPILRHWYSRKLVMPSDSGADSRGEESRDGDERSFDSKSHKNFQQIVFRVPFNLNFSFIISSRQMFSLLPEFCINSSLCVFEWTGIGDGKQRGNKVEYWFSRRP